MFNHFHMHHHAQSYKHFPPRICNVLFLIIFKALGVLTSGGLDQAPCPPDMTNSDWQRTDQKIWKDSHYLWILSDGSGKLNAGMSLHVMILLKDVHLFCPQISRTLLRIGEADNPLNSHWMQVCHVLDSVSHVREHAEISESESADLPW